HFAFCSAVHPSNLDRISSEESACAYVCQAKRLFLGRNRVIRKTLHFPQLDGWGALGRSALVVHCSERTRSCSRERSAHVSRWSTAFLQLQFRNPWSESFCGFVEYGAAHVLSRGRFQFHVGFLSRL